MNDSNSDVDAFERQLRQFRPARPSDELMARLENRPTPRSARTGIDFRAVVRFFAPGLGGATALAVILACWFVAHHGLPRVAMTANFGPTPFPASRTPLVCVHSTDAVVAARDEGIYTKVDGQPVQVIRLLDLNKSVWKDPRNGNRMEVVVPRQQFLVGDVETY